MERGGGAPSQDGDPTAESIVTAATPVRRDAGPIPNTLGPLLRRVRRHTRRVGIDGQANASGRRLDPPGFMSSQERGAEA
jgi:hypothetical protein